MLYSVDAFRQQGSAPMPHFDSVLRAAPAYDDDDSDWDDGASMGSSVSHSKVQYTSSPQDLQELTMKAKKYAASHTSFHAYLDANTHLEHNIKELQNRIHEESGKLTSRKAELRRLEKQKASLLSQRKGKAKLLWTPKKRSSWRGKLNSCQHDQDTVKEAVIYLDNLVHQEKQHVQVLEDRWLEYNDVERRLDRLDDDIFGPGCSVNEKDREIQEKYHVLMETSRRLESTVQLEVRAQKHLSQAATSCQTLTKELLAGLQIGVQIGVPSNVKHKTQLWSGTSPTHSSRASRGLLLRAKTLSGDLHSNYIQARAIQGKIAILPPLEVVSLTRLPDVRSKDALNENSLHRSLEASYAQAKIVQTHIEVEKRKSKARQIAFKRYTLDLQKDARQTWLQLRNNRKIFMQGLQDKDTPSSAIMDVHIQNTGSDYNVYPPSYKHYMGSSSTRASTEVSATQVSGKHRRATVFDEQNSSEDKANAQQRQRYMALPQHVRRTIDKKSMLQSKEIIQNICLQDGSGAQDDDNKIVSVSALEEDLPGLHLSFGF